MCNLKAESVINFLLVSHLVYGGKIPKTVQELMACDQVKWKKAYIIMNLVGQYVGVGRDSHVNIFFKLFILDKDIEDGLEMNYLDSFSNYLKMNPGMHTNELIAGEVSCSYMFMFVFTTTF